MSNEGIPSLVKRLREELGLTQEQFARAIGSTCGTISRWENGHRYPQPHLLRRLREFNASIEKKLQNNQ